MEENWMHFKKWVTTTLEEVAKFNYPFNNDTYYWEYINEDEGRSYIRNVIGLRCVLLWFMTLPKEIMKKGREVQEWLEQGFG